MLLVRLLAKVKVRHQHVLRQVDEQVADEHVVRTEAGDARAERDRSGDAVLPWDIIDGGMKTSFFRAEFDKGLREEWTLPPKRQKENAKFLPVLQ